MALPAFLTRTRLLALGMVVLVGGGYWYYRSTQNTDTTARYVLAQAANATIVTSIKGTGQVSGLREFQVTPEVSARVVKTFVKVGEQVKAGTPLVDLDRREALKAVRDASQSVREAQISLDAASLQYQKTIQPSDKLSIIQAENAVAKAKRDLEDLQNGPTAFDLKQAQADVDVAAERIRLTEDGSMPRTVRDAYDTYVTTLQGIGQTLDKALTDANTVLSIDSTVNSIRFQKYISILDTAKKDSAKQAYLQAQISNIATQDAVKHLQITNESPEEIESASRLADTAISQMTTLLQRTAEALQASLTASDFSQSELDGLKNTIDSDRTSVAGKLTSLLNQKQAIQRAKEEYQTSQLSYQKALNSLDKVKAGATTAEIATAQERVTEATEQLASLQAKPEKVDVELARNTLEQRKSALSAAQNRLQDANETLNKYTVLAPFDGLVASVPVDVASDASPGTAVATLVTSQKIVTTPLNEVDAAKVKPGQKATVVFDAIEGLSLAGEVILVEPMGTVSQGVVNYNVQIGFDSDDARIKSGMSASVSIITEVHPDVLTVPNSAVKNQNDVSYIETLPNAPESASSGQPFSSTEQPQRIVVEVGASNEDVTEITSGLKSGDSVIMQTIVPTAARTTTQNTNALRLPIGGGGGGAVFRAGIGR